jgi:3-oxoacyl-[acyl-carrier protein] reductase
MSKAGLDGRIAFITGAGSGLGAAAARRLALDGARIVVNDINADAATAVAAEVGGEAQPFDVVDSVAFDAAVDKVVATHGRLDIMVNNAGIAPPPDPARIQHVIANEMAKMEGRYGDMSPVGSWASITDEAWDRMIKVHQYGTFYGMRAALRHMEPQRSGVIVNISSILGVSPAAGAPHYGAAKAAIVSLTRSAAAEVAPFGIRVNAICPGYIDTPLLAPFDEMTRGLILMRIGTNRMGRAQEIAELVRFLSGDESSYCTGEIVTASGGYA